jgi:hypothetical protein
MSEIVFLIEDDVDMLSLLAFPEIKVQVNQLFP